MTVKIFSWLAGLTLVLIFLVIVSPDLYRGYVYSLDRRGSGQRTYETYCVGCHGLQGQGNGEAAGFLNPKPRNFVKGDYKFFHFGEPGPFPSDESLLSTIRNGLPGSSMPAFPLLTDQEIKDVMSYAKHFKEGGWVQPKPIQAAAGPVPLAGESGEELFKSAGCIGCHQFDPLQAAGGVGPNLTTIGSRLSIADIQQSIVNPNAVLATGCPAGPCPPGVMPPNFAERLSAAQIDTLVAYLAAHK